MATCSGTGCRAPRLELGLWGCVWEGDGCFSDAGLALGLSGVGVSPAGQSPLFRSHTALAVCL